MPSAAPLAVAPSQPLDRRALAEVQRDRLHALLHEILPRNPFYAHKFAEVGLRPEAVTGPDDLTRLPFTTKAELTACQEAHPPYGDLLTYARDRYCRLHQTSGTAGKPLRWLDTSASWDWMLDCWQQMFDIAGIVAGDRAFFPFSFGPFLGFWTAFEAASRRGLLCLPGGGMSSGARLRFMLDNQASVVFCTPTYALHLGEVARTEGIDLAHSSVRLVIVAGEPGGSIVPTRARIEQTWGARVFDHSGMTETGPAAIECPENPAGLHLLESEFIVEVIDPKTCQPVPNGQTGELVLTNLGRWGSPLLRYRTGDLVRVDSRPCPCGRVERRLGGGILGRVDDMIHVRGNNLYPSALEGLLRRFPEVAEYRIEIDDSAALPVLRVELEPVSPALGEQFVERVDRAIRDELLFRADVRAVEPGSLPRFEMKARRISRKGAKAQRESEGEAS